MTAPVYFLMVPQLGSKDSAASGGIELESIGMSKGDAALKCEVRSLKAEGKNEPLRGPDK